jgi:hypothetical protein
MRGVPPAASLAQQKRIKGSDCRQAPLNTAWTQAAGVLGRSKGPYLPVVQRVPRANAALAAEFRQLNQIAAVRRGRVRAQTAFELQVRDKPIDPCALIRGHGARLGFSG